MDMPMWLHLSACVTAKKGIKSKIEPYKVPQQMPLSLTLFALVQPIKTK